MRSLCIAMTGPQTPAARLTFLLILSLVVAGLYFARDVLQPLALAILISFLLAPLIRRLERWGLGRVTSVITATLFAFGIISVVGYLVAGQVIDLADRLPDYKANLGQKISAFKTTPGSPFSRATRTLRELNRELTEAQDSVESGEPVAGPQVGPAVPLPPPVPVAVMKTPESALTSLQELMAPIIAPLGTAAIVIIFVIFILLEREDLRDRIIHLVGRSRLGVTTQAMDDAARRVSRYLLAQLIVNVTYGIPIGIGLYFIGIPNAFLWALLCAVLRFVPYIGPWIGASLPLLLSLAVSPSWAEPLLTLGLFIVVELISNNIVEPWLYGASTGLSPMAIIVSAVFWTWLWGTPGLLLATPLTVCIAVLGKYVPNLSFLDVLLGDKPPITVADRFYQRLLAIDQEETLELVEAHIQVNALPSAFDEIVAPSLRRCESDFRSGELDAARREEMFYTVRELLAELGDAHETEPDEARVVCLPASNEADELAGIMLARLLADAGVKVAVLSSKLMTGELIEKTVAAAPRVVCISALTPSSVMSAMHLCKRLRERLETGMITVGLWGEGAPEASRRLERLKRVSADHVFTTLDEAAGEIRVQPALITETLAPDKKAA